MFKLRHGPFDSWGGISSRIVESVVFFRNFIGMESNGPCLTSVFRFNQGKTHNINCIYCWLIMTYCRKQVLTNADKHQVINLTDRTLDM